MKVTVTIVIFLFVICYCTCIGQPVPKNRIVYNVDPTFGDSSILKVKFVYKTNKEGTLSLIYENSSWGDNDLFNCIKNFSVIPVPESIQFLRDSSLIKIKYRPNQRLTISYSIVKDFNGPPLNQHRYRPILEKTYFHILGMRLFIVPRELYKSEFSRANIEIRWREISTNRIFHSSFGKESVQKLKVTREELDASFYVGGDFNRYHFNYKGDSIYFVTRGDWKAFNDKAIFDILKETISFQNDFWADARGGMFSVSLLPTFETWTESKKRNSIGGSGFQNSFISFASNNEGTTLERMRWLYNHELLHKWISRTIKNENEVEQYWFSEGFTDYYSYKLMLKNDKLTPQEFISALNNEVVIPHYKDPINSIPNSELTFQKYWSNYKVYQKLPYRRGLLYAFLIDTKIKKRSGFTQSLDNVMHDLLKMALEDETMRLNSLVFKQMLVKYLEKSALNDFDDYILKGHLIDFTDKLPDGLSLEIHDEIPIFKMKPDNDLAEFKNRLKL